MQFKPHLLDNHEILKVERLPARLNAEQAACLLGFLPHDIPILTKLALLKPLGSPPQNGVKYFATVTVLRLMENEEFLHKATKALSNHWKTRNARRGNENKEGKKDVQQ